MRRSIRSVRNAISSSPSPSRHSFAPYASPTAMRTTEMGKCAPPIGTTPGMRLPVRTITWPPISSRRIRLGLPTSPAPSGVTVAALRPSPCSRTALAASCTTSLAVDRRDSNERSKRGSSSSTPITSGASTRRDCSSSSWPVSSPPSTTIVRVSIAAECSGGATSLRSSAKIPKPPKRSRSVLRRPQSRSTRTSVALFACSIYPRGRPERHGRSCSSFCTLLFLSVELRSSTQLQFSGGISWHERRFSFATTAAPRSARARAPHCGSRIRTPAGARRPPISVTTAPAGCLVAQPPAAAVGRSRPRSRTGCEPGTGAPRWSAAGL